VSQRLLQDALHGGDLNDDYEVSVPAKVKDGLWNLLAKEGRSVRAPPSNHLFGTHFMEVFSPERIAPEARREEF